MHLVRNSGSAIVLSAAAAAAMLLVNSRLYAQQSPTDPVVTETGDDGNYGSTSNQSGFNFGTPWSASTGGTGTQIGAGIAPAPGYAYVDEGYRLRTPATQNGTAGAATSFISFAGDSLTLVSPSPSPYLGVPDDGVGGLNLGTSGQYSYVTLKANAASNTTNINHLVLANGGVLFNYANDFQSVTGNIFLVPLGTVVNDGTSSGFTTTISGGIIDTHGNNLSGYGGSAYVTENYFSIGSNISGGGMLRIENTGGGTIGTTTGLDDGVQLTNGYVPQVVVLSGSNTFTGGLVLDGTGTAGITGNGPVLAVNSTNAIGTGPLTILATSTPNANAPGVAIDNLSGASETLTTNNPQVWDGAYTFIGTNSLNMGSGAITMGPDLGSNMQITVVANTLVLGGSVTGSQGFNKSGAGTLILNGVLSYSGITNVLGGSLQLGASVSNLSGGVFISGGTLALSASHGYFTTPSLSIAGTTSAWTGLLDIGKSALDLPGASLSQVTNQVQQGYNNGAWNGSGGITSSAAAANTAHLTAVGVILNDNGSGVPLYGSGGTIASTFNGGSPADGDVLVKYVYYGDTNLNGKVDGTDYNRIDAAFIADRAYLAANQGGTSLPATGWYNGDFNYDGLVNGSDYTLMDNAFNGQGVSLAAAVASPTSLIASVSVPEPTSIGLLILGAAGILGRRRQR